MYKCIKRGAIVFGETKFEMKRGADVTEVTDVLDEGVVKSLVKNGFIVDADKELAAALAEKKEQQEKLDAIKEKRAEVLANAKVAKEKKAEEAQAKADKAKEEAVAAAKKEKGKGK